MGDEREREKRRERRLREEAGVASQGRRTRLLQLGAAAVFLAIVVVVVLIVGSGGDGGGDAESLQEVAEVEKLFAGIEQNGMTLGDPQAPVELIEFADLQCPFCKQYSEEVIPPIIEDQVKRGQAKISFRNYVILGDESVAAGAAALAAGEQGVGWNYIELFYRNQGTENSGYVTEEFLEAVAKGVGVEEMAAWNEARKGRKLEEEVQATTNEAQNRFHLTGTPSLAIEGPGTNGIKVLGQSETESTAALEAAIAAAS